MNSYTILFSRLVLRPLRREPVRALLMVLAVALGVGVVLAIEMAGEAAAGSFRSSMETLAGDADYEVTATGGLSPETLTRLALLPRPIELRPRIEDYAVLNRRTLPLIGIDVLSESSTRSGDGEFEPNTVWVGEALGLRRGDRIRLVINDAAAEYAVGGLLRGDANEAVVMDLSLAAKALRRESLDRILIKAEVADEQAIRAALPPGATLAPHGSRTDENRKMLAAFRWNLRVLSYIALIVGAFLIYNAIAVSVVRRRAEVGIVRALGATRALVMAAFLGEAMFYGIVGGAVGLLAGRAMAAGAVTGVAATVESLYVSSAPGAIELTLPLAIVGLLLGCATSLVSALIPAWEASRVPPVEAMGRGRIEHQARVRSGWAFIGAGVCAGLAYVTSQQPPVAGKPLFGYLSALLMIAATALAIPTLVRGVRVPRRFGAVAVLASRSLAGSMRRTSVLVAALATAIGMTAAVGIMVGSFRQTVIVWMNDRLKADIYLRPAVPPAADRHPTMEIGVVEALRKLPAVQSVETLRAYEITYNGKPATFGGTDGRYDIERDTVLVSEPFANKHGVRVGDRIQIALGSQRPTFRVAEIYFDYSNERGFVLTDRATLLKYLPDPAPSNVAVYLRPGVDLDEAVRSVKNAVGARRIVALTNRTLREQAIRIFDRTFAITYALEAVAVFVAIMGVAGALLALVLDRRREFGLLRFLGADVGQVRRLIVHEAAMLGLLANVAGLLLGYALSLLLIYVVNRQSFGWTIQFHWPVAMLLTAMSAVYLATLLASLYPAREAARLNPIEVVHEE